MQELGASGLAYRIEATRPKPRADAAKVNLWCHWQMEWCSFKLYHCRRGA